MEKKRDKYRAIEKPSCQSNLKVQAMISRQRYVSSLIFANAESERFSNSSWKNVLHRCFGLHHTLTLSLWPQLISFNLERYFVAAVTFFEQLFQKSGTLQR